MSIVGICLIIFAIVVVFGVLGSYIYKRRHNIPTCPDCTCTSKKKMLKAYNKMYHKNDKKHSCGCSSHKD